jgi:Cu(I)/Ag(I) efflux system membrane fusion protein
LLGGCTGGQSSSDSAATSEHETAADLARRQASKGSLPGPDAFKPQLDKVIKAYLATKDALVATDAGQTDQKTGELLSALGQVDAAPLPADAGEKWTEHRKIMERAATSMQAAQNIEAKRTSFEDLSKAAYALVNDFGAGTTLYKEYCPMAFNDKGAFWLSAKSEIKNPYFGDKMLECGEVQEVLQFQASN